jgi:hypothetical protein
MSMPQPSVSTALPNLLNYPTSYGQTVSSGTSTSESAPVDTLDAELSREISQIAEQYGSQVFNWANSTLAPNTSLTDDAVGQYMAAANTQFNTANQTANAYNNIGAPALATLNNNAGSYGSTARQQVNAGSAEATAQQGTQAGISQAEQNLQSYGINPNSGMYQELEQSQRAAAGAGAATAGNTAAQQTRQQGQALQTAAVAADQQLPGQSANAAAAGTGATSGAVNAQLANTTTGATALDAANPFMSTAQNISAEGTGSNSSSTSNSESTNENVAYAGAKGPSSGSASLAHGGAIPEDATTGGFVSHHLSPSGGAKTDDIPARLNADEFVMPKDVAHWYGKKTFQDMIIKARKAMGDPGQAPAQPQMKHDSPPRSNSFQMGGVEPSPGVSAIPTGSAG